MNETLSAKLRVRSYELDSYNHVNNATYLQYLEYARGEYMRQMGMPFSNNMPDQIRFFVVSATLNFKAPATVNEELEIIGVIKKIGNTSFTIKQDIYNLETKVLVLDAEITIVFIDQNDKPTRIPEYYREMLQQYYQV